MQVEDNTIKGIGDCLEFDLKIFAMKTLHVHITVFRKINPKKTFWEFSYYDEKSFQSAAFGTKNDDTFKIYGTYYRIETVEKISSMEKILKLLVKQGWHTVLKGYLDRLIKSPNVVPMLYL